MQGGATIHLEEREHLGQDVVDLECYRMAELERLYCSNGWVVVFNGCAFLRLFLSRLSDCDKQLCSYEICGSETESQDGECEAVVSCLVNRAILFLNEVVLKVMRTEATCPCTAQSGIQAGFIQE